MRACVLSPAQLTALMSLRHGHRSSSWRLEQDEDGRLLVVRLGPGTGERVSFRVSPGGRIEEG